MYQSLRACIGSDNETAVGRKTRGWVRHAMQTSRYYISSCKYNKLNHLHRETHSSIIDRLHAAHACVCIGMNDYRSVAVHRVIYVVVIGCRWSLCIFYQMLGLQSCIMMFANLHWTAALSQSCSLVACLDCGDHCVRAAEEAMLVLSVT